jgi:hypothetical protein
MRVPSTVRQNKFAMPPAMTIVKQQIAFHKACKSALRGQCPTELYFRRFTTVIEDKRIYEVTYKTELAEKVFNTDFPLIRAWPLCNR